MTAVGRCAAQGMKKEAASPPLTFDQKAAARQAGGRAARGVRGRPSGLQAAAHRCATALRAGLDPGAPAAPGRQETRARPKGLPPARTAPGDGGHPVW